VRRSFVARLALSDFGSNNQVSGKNARQEHSNLCRAYGAPDFFCRVSQAFRPGLTYAAPTALGMCSARSESVNGCFEEKRSPRGTSGRLDFCISASARSKGAASGAEAPFSSGLTAGLKPRPSGWPVYAAASGLWSKIWLASAVVVLSGVVACGASNAPSSAASASSNSAAPGASAAANQSEAAPKLAEIAPPADQTGGFDGAKAYDQVAKLVAFGPHPSDTAAIRSVQAYIHAQLESYGCAVEEDAFNAPSPMGSLAMKNIVAKIPGTGQGIILLLTHYDTKRVDGFVGAEDAGSSSGLMLEMARILCGGGKPKQPNSVWIAFLDGEETQATFQWSTPDSIYGSRELAARMAVSGDLKRVKAVILADMVGQYNLHIQRDSDSPKWLTDLIWNTAGRLGYGSVFVSSDTSTEDDNIPFNERHVPTIDLIDLNDYISAGYWHTPQDTMDKVSPRSVAIVGYVILESVDELQKKFH